MNDDKVEWNVFKQWSGDIDEVRMRIVSYIYIRLIWGYERHSQVNLK